MKKTFTFFFATIMVISIFAQVPKKVVVEHFTNTRCSVCASRNPGFYTNLSNQSDALHVAFHPSSPYSNCYLNNQNKLENDNRTKFYNLYGSTPKFAIQGDVVPSSQDVSKPSLFTPYVGQLSEASIRINHEKVGGNIKVSVTVKSEVNNGLGNMKLFVCLVEDTVAYSAPNGEKFHYDVFRKALTDVEGDALSFPAVAGDSLTFTYNEFISSDWSTNRIYALAILQEDPAKVVIQSAATSSELTGRPVGLVENEVSQLSFYPNPVNDALFIESNEGIDYLRLLSITGEVKVVKENIEKGKEKIDMTAFPRGIYFIEYSIKGQREVKKLILN